MFRIQFIVVHQAGKVQGTRANQVVDTSHLSSF